jgi:hypothetical protein
MVLSEWERQILLLNLSVEAVPSEAPDTDMSFVFNAIQEAFDNQKAFMAIGERASEDGDGETSEAADENNNIISIRALERGNDGTFTILLQHGDTQAPDPAFMDIRDFSIRKAGKKPTDGLAHAAHLIISQRRSRNRQSRALLERVPNLGRGIVLTFLNRLLREYAAEQELTFLAADTKRQRRYHPKLVTYQQLSHQLRADIQRGRLFQIEFVRHQVHAGFEEPDEIVPVSEILECRTVAAPPRGSRALQLIERAKQWARDNQYDEIQLRMQKTDTGKYLSPRFSTDISDAADAIYARHEILAGFPSRLDQCPESIVRSLQSRMIPLLRKDSLWR